MRGTFVNRETTSKLIIQSEGLKMNNLSLSRNFLINLNQNYT